LFSWRAERNFTPSESIAVTSCAVSSLIRPKKHLAPSALMSAASAS
jgi:hypothetical protein